MVAILVTASFPKRRITKKCTRAAKSGVLKWTISRRRRVILDVRRLKRPSLRNGIQTNQRRRSEFRSFIRERHELR